MRRRGVAELPFMLIPVSASLFPALTFVSIRCVENGRQRYGPVLSQGAPVRSGHIDLPPLDSDPGNDSHSADAKDSAPPRGSHPGAFSSDGRCREANLITPLYTDEMVW